nr:reverse transcriptase domain-containing protein [Tanacetum cinerariifolium]
SSGLGTLPSNTIANPKEDLKGITTRSGTAYQGPMIPTTSSSLPSVVERETEATKDTMHPTNNRSTKDVQPLVVQTESLILNSEPVVALIIKPVAFLVIAVKPNQRPSIPYPSRFHNQKLHDKDNYQTFSAAISVSEEEVIELDDSLRWTEESQSLCSIDGITMSQSQTVIEGDDQTKRWYDVSRNEERDTKEGRHRLCNAPGTFQRCMMAIFHDMIEKTMEVFMDEFLVFKNYFQNCLSHLERMLKRCEETNLCLNWEKSHFMVKEGIVLCHKISKNMIKVNKAKVDVISKLPHPTTVKCIRSFLGHAGFYQRFIQNFAKIVRPITRLLEKDTRFLFSKECVEAFQTLKRKLTEAPILISPDLDLPFELMCNASDFATGAALGQRQEKHFRPIHYASKTMTEAE